MRTINAYDVSNALLLNLPNIATHIPQDIYDALVKARDNETSERAAIVLDQLVTNADIARKERMPICQDTGNVWICLEVGPDVNMDGDVFDGVNDVVAAAFKSSRLRMSMCKDALFDRTNTGDNTPAYHEMHYTPIPGARLHIMLKGGGSDNASRIVMLPPSAGKQGVIDAVVQCVQEKAANACPPLVIGVGVGTTFDKVASLAKRSMMHPINVPHPDPRAAAFEQELLEAVNATGIGAGALGGNTTALGVKIGTRPCHIAALPVAINMGCCAMRRMTIEL